MCETNLLMNVWHKFINECVKQIQKWQWCPMAAFIKWEWGFGPPTPKKKTEFNSSTTKTFQETPLIMELR